MTNNKTNYRKKYLKYKTKYFNLKELINRNIGQTGSSSERMPNNDIARAFDSLVKSDTKSFEISEIGYNDDDRKLIESISITKPVRLNYFGKFNASKQKKYISKYIQDIGNSKKKSDQLADLVVEKIIGPFIKSSSKDSMWLKMDVMFPHDGFNIGRWHMDGYYYFPHKYLASGDKQYKLVSVLKGPVTLFKPNEEGLLDTFHRVHRELYKDFDYKNFDRSKDMEYRKIIDKALNKYETIIPTNKQAAIFIAGDNKRGAMHSEPPHDKKRLFLSVLPGTEDEVKDHASRWKQPYGKPIYES